MATLTPERLVELKAHYLPDDAATHGWDDDTIALRWSGGFASTARMYWLDRVTDTAKYLDIPDPGGTLPITQIHRQAMEMLAYWDAYLVKFGDALVFTGSRPTRIGKIKRRYEIQSTQVGPSIPTPYTPYNPTD